MQKAVTDFFTHKAKGEEFRLIGKPNEGNHCVYLDSLNVEVSRVQNKNDSQFAVPNNNLCAIVKPQNTENSERKECENESCVKVKEKYEKLKKAYAKALQTNSMYAEKLLNYEGETKRQQKCVQKVSFAYYTLHKGIQ